MNYMDAEAMKTMMKMSGDIFAITNEEPSDPSKFIMPTMGPINNWTWVGFSENMGVYTIFIKDKSHDHEIV